jgi:hypothetical protein
MPAPTNLSISLRFPVGLRFELSPAFERALGVRYAIVPATRSGMDRSSEGRAAWVAGNRDVVGMIRFVLKSALALGLLAMVVPLGNASRDEGTGLDLFGVANGLREAAEDVGGFCTRAPAACDAGRQVAAFAGERIEAGLRIGASYLNERFPEPSVGSRAAIPAEGARPDPVTTGALEPPQGPRPYQPPRPAAATDTVAAGSDSIPFPLVVAVPTPAPRG